MTDKLFTKRLRDLTDEAIRESLAEISVEFEKRFGPAALTASTPVVDDLSPATRRMEQILDAPFVRKGEAPQAFERLQAMMPADRARDGMTTIAVRGEDMRALLDAILDRSATSAPPVVEREAIGEIAATILRDVCELGGYTSPDDQPDLLQCTIGELDLIVRRALGDDQ